MSENRALVIVNSVYQLINAVQIKRSLLHGRPADLLLTDILPDARDYLPRLEQTGLFDRVIFALSMETNQKYAGAKEPELSECYRNTANFLRWALSDELTDYAEIYFSNYDVLTRMLACRFYHRPCAFICYEDGFSTYVIDYLREDRAPVNRHPDGRKIRDKVQRVLLYEPALAMRGDRLPNVSLPKIDRRDSGLRELFNHIFGYRDSARLPRFIFLEQSFRAEGIRTNDIDLMRECREAAGGDFIVKPHPRNRENLPQEMGLTRKYPDHIPWELFLLNLPEDEKQQHTLLTVCSNAALTSRLVFGLDMNTVMLYRLFEGKVLWKEDATLWRYLERFRREFAGRNYYVPQTRYALRNTLMFLGGQNGKSD